jgi:hypothetical protein
MAKTLFIVIAALLLAPAIVGLVVGTIGFAVKVAVLVGIVGLVVVGLKKLSRTDASH